MSAVGALGCRRRNALSRGATSSAGGGWLRRQGRTLSTVGTSTSSHNLVNRTLTRRVPIGRGLHRDQAEHVVIRQFRPTVEESQFDDEREPGDVTAEALDEPAGRCGGAAGGQYVVDDVHPFAGRARGLGGFERIAAGLQG